MPPGKPSGLHVVRRTLAPCSENALIMGFCVWTIGSIAISATGAVNLTREIVVLSHNAWSLRWLYCLLQGMPCENCANRGVPGFGSTSRAWSCESGGSAEVSVGDCNVVGYGAAASQRLIQRRLGRSTPSSCPGADTLHPVAPAPSRSIERAPALAPAAVCERLPPPSELFAGAYHYGGNLQVRRKA